MSRLFTSKTGFKNGKCPFYKKKRHIDLEDKLTDLRIEETSKRLNIDKLLKSKSNNQIN